MSTKEQFLKECIHKQYPLEDKRWYLALLAILLPTDKAPTDKYIPTRKPTGLVYLDEEGVEQSITDAKPQQPLYRPTDRLTIDASWLPYVQGSIETTVGRLLLNAAAFYPSLGGRIGYVNKPMTPKSIEASIAALMKNEDEIKNPDKEISVPQYVDCMDRVWFFTKLSSIVTVAATPKTVLPAPGVDQLRNKLLKENEGKLSNPVVVATIADALDAHDKEYLKDDPAAAHILGKKGKTARKKLYQMYGETNDFAGGLGSDPITSTMQQGVDTSEAVLPKYMNDLRMASYSRGHSTQLSGYSYKILQRSLSGLEIAQEPCSVQKGLERVVTNPNKLINRYIRAGSKWSLVSNQEEAGTYLGKAIMVRSPMYCTAGNNSICYACLGENYKGAKNAINNIAAGFSGELMTLFLKRMHTSGFSLTDIHMKDLVG